MVKFFKIFFISTGILLLLTAAAKIVSAGGIARILDLFDPIFGLPFRAIFWTAGILELVVSSVCLFGKSLSVKALAVACIATNFLLYRIGLTLMGYHSPCPCLGNLTDALRIPPQIADTVMKIILAYLFIGSYGTLFWLWRQRRKAIPA